MGILLFTYPQFSLFFNISLLHVWFNLHRFQYTSHSPLHMLLVWWTNYSNPRLAEPLEFLLQSLRNSSVVCVQYAALNLPFPKYSTVYCIMFISHFPWLAFHTFSNISKFRRYDKSRLPLSAPSFAGLLHVLYKLGATSWCVHMQAGAGLCMHAITVRVHE